MEALVPWMKWARARDQASKLGLGPPIQAHCRSSVLLADATFQLPCATGMAKPLDQAACRCK